MKTTISTILVRNAVEYVERARTAQADGRLDEEVRFSIGAQLMIALAVEGIGNEIGEIALDRWTWERLERSDTPLKWQMISEIIGKNSFKPDAEPLQTIERLYKIRNRLAHPKVLDFGEETIIRAKNGDIRRNVQLDDAVGDGDFVMLGVGKLLDSGFNARSSFELVQKAIAATKTISRELKILGLEWVDDMEKDLNEGGQR